ncbi:MAG: hypothetical protein ACPIOQ_11095 [Promethearchaeia archaeon]
MPPPSLSQYVRAPSRVDRCGREGSDVRAQCRRLNGAAHSRHARACGRPRFCGRRGAIAATRATGTRFASYSLPALPYDVTALEPVVNTEIMTLHHTKHHQTYVTNLNASLEKYVEAEAKGDVATMIALQGAIKFNGGGHVNHSIFWTNLCSPKDAVDVSSARWVE